MTSSATVIGIPHFGSRAGVACGESRLGRPRVGGGRGATMLSSSRLFPCRGPIAASMEALLGRRPGGVTAADAGGAGWCLLLQPGRADVMHGPQRKPAGGRGTPGEPGGPGQATGGAVRARTTARAIVPPMTRISTAISRQVGVEGAAPDAVAELIQRRCRKPITPRPSVAAVLARTRPPYGEARASGVPMRRAAVATPVAKTSA